jgi:transposase
MPAKDMAAYMAQRRMRKASAGWCTKCTARKPRPGYDQCRQCIEAGTISKRLSRRKKRIRQLLGKE